MLYKRWAASGATGRLGRCVEAAREETAVGDVRGENEDLFAATHESRASQRVADLSAFAVGAVQVAVALERQSACWDELPDLAGPSDDAH